MICLDPGKQPPSTFSSTPSSTYGDATKVLERVRVPEEGLKVRRQYQILRFDEGVLVGKGEWEEGRVVRGLRVPGD